ncbi:MAG: endolytic transglycosylase MltG [Candidatus Peregrinibacteria bacterium]
MKKLLLLLVVIFSASYGWYRFELRPISATNSARVKVDIPKGASVDRIGELLSSSHLIRSQTAFKLFTRFHGSSASLQAGTFLLSPSMGVQDIVAVLHSGKSEEMSITIPEGFSVRDIDALLHGKGISSSGAILNYAMKANFSSFDFVPQPVSGLVTGGGQLEGYLFPETYNVSVAGFDRRLFLERMLETFRKNVIDKYGSEIQKSGHTLHEIVTMASLVEAETRLDSERPLVAGIFWKRLQLGMPLGVDATVHYITGSNVELTATDLASDSPYNTRKVKGLPPGPIENPGMASILAALRPVASPYLYYLHDRKGVIHYAVTNDEHNVNRRKYLGD